VGFHLSTKGNLFYHLLNLEDSQLLGVPEPLRLKSKQFNPPKRTLKRGLVVESFDIYLF